ncbi:MAG: class I SAM-dependent methyltransferase [Candidatus Odinarchaeota archaeon]
MPGTNYYSDRLSASRLKRCYDIASSRIRQYLEAEIQFVLKHIKETDTVLELGCGYGRVLARLAWKAGTVHGIDTSKDSLQLAKEFLRDISNVKLYEMNAGSLDFEKRMFDVVIAIQNGISAFKVDPRVLVKESLRVTKDGGKILLSSYSANIWEERLEWFIRQSKEGLLGEINFEKTGAGTIICKDGFKATTYTAEDFSRLISEMKLEANIEEIDQSSIFCTIQVNRQALQR